MADDDNDPNKLKSYSITDLLKLERREELVRRLFFKKGITTVATASGGGKTTMFFCLGLYVSIALWGEEQIEQRPLFWIAGEDQDGLKPLLETWMKHNPDCIPDARYMNEAVDFASQNETNKLIKHLEGTSRPLIMADALSDVLAIRGLDEDKSKEVTRVYKGVRRVLDALDASFGVLHHQGWTERRERGSSAIRDNSEIVVRIKKFDPAAGMVELEHLKRRSGAGPKLKAFYLSAKLITVEGYRDQIPIVTGPMEASMQAASKGATTAKKEEEDATRAEQNYVLMIKKLREFFSNKATRGDWQKHLEQFDGTGWSKSSRLNVLKARGWLRIVGNAETLRAGERVPEGAMLEATEKAPIVAEDGTNTTKAADTSTTSGTTDGTGVGNQLHQTSVTPLRGGGDTASHDAGLSDDKPLHQPQTALNEAGEAGSTKDGNGSGPVVPDSLNGSQSELAKAKKIAMEQFKKGKPPHAA
jgi:hypothetical protein